MTETENPHTIFYHADIAGAASKSAEWRAAMKLYRKIAENLIGKRIDCFNRRFGYYPMEIIKIGDDLYVKDATGTCMKIPESEDDFNCHDLDFVVEGMEE